jgi:hypothetical protein
MTVDKIICDFPAFHSLLDKEEQLEEKSINFYGKNDGVMITDFDDFMENGNHFIKE